MSTQNAVSVESPRPLAADMDESGASSSERRPSSARVNRISLFGCFIEIEESASVLPRSILGC